MKTNENGSDSFAYICLCLGTFGIAALIRVMITVAIRKAFEEQ